MWRSFVVIIHKYGKCIFLEAIKELFLHPINSIIAQLQSEQRLYWSALERRLALTGWWSNGSVSMFANEEAFLKSGTSTFLTFWFNHRRVAERCSCWSMSLLTMRPVTFSPRRNRHRRLTDERRNKPWAAHLRRSCHFKNKDRLDTWERMWHSSRCSATRKRQARLWFKIHSTAPPSFADTVTFSNCIMQKMEERCVSFSLLLCSSWWCSSCLTGHRRQFLPPRVKLDKRHGDVSCCLPFILVLG